MAMGRFGVVGVAVMAIKSAAAAKMGWD